MANEISNLITFNTYKFERGGLLVDMFNQFNARVGDQGTELAIQWETSKTGTKINLKERELHFFAAGSVGQYLEKLEDGTGFKMSADASTVEWEDKDEAGSLDDGITVVKLPKQFFPQKGIFFGYFGLKDRQGNIFTSVNVWFRVLGGIPTMGAAIPYFVTEFDEVLERCNGKIVDALAELREKYQAEVKKNEDMSAETRAALSKLADSVGVIQAQIDAGNVVTRLQHQNDINLVNQKIDDRLNKMAMNLETLPNLDAIKAKYPNGTDGLVIAADTMHKWIYTNNQWVDGGSFMSAMTTDQQNKLNGIYQDPINITSTTITDGAIKPAYGVDLGRHWLFIQASDDNVRKRAGELDYPQPVTDEQGVFTYTRSADSQQFSQSWITADHIYIRQMHDQVWSDWQVYQPYKVDADRNLLNGKVGATTDDSVVTKVQFMGHDWSQLTATGTNGSRGIEWFLTGNGELSQFFNKSTLFSTDIFPMYTQTLTLTVNFYDAAGNNLNKGIDIDKLSLIANQPIHYQELISIDSGLATDVAKVGISIQTRSTADIGKTLFGATELTSNFDSYENNSGLLTTPAIVQSGDQNTSVSETVFVGEIWHKLSLTNNAGVGQGLMWKVMDNNTIYMLFHSRGRFSFDIYPYVTLTATVNIHFYDYFGNDLNKTVTIDTVNFQTGQMKHYDHVFALEESLADNVVQIGISIEAINSSDNASFLVRGEKLLIEYSSEDDALNTPASDLPAVYLSGDVNTMTKDNKVSMNFVFKDRTRTIVGYSATKWQGDSSLGYAKKAYRIQTFSDSAMKNKLKFKPKVDWAEGNKWNLKAYYTDALLCRDVVNANIGADVWANADHVPNTLIKADNYGFIDGFPVKLYLNGDFAGIYSFNIAKGDYGSDVQAIVGSVQAGAAQFGALPDGGVKLDGKADYEMIYPDDPTDEIKTSLNNLIKFVATSTDEDFKAQFEQYFDKTSVIDYLIFCNIIEDTDAWIKNQTLFTVDGKKWYYHPYDLDMSLGSGSDGAVFNPTKGIIGLESNRLFKRVATIFGSDVKSRYKALRSWLTPAYILNRYRQHMDRIGVANYQAEEDVWHDSTVAFANYTVLKSHVYNRFKELDKAWLG
ncbi:CotH kinase family protein [Limosilactobacillus reuteri]|uniref:CotH kinase family protein n=1 Tax=Limosilactobacillus reuteri TaxID=1598 RepID=UPI003994A596